MRALFAVALGLLAFAAHAEPFRLTSPDIHKGAPDPALASAASLGFGCDGANRAPRLNWSGAPKGTQSFLLTLYDKDAPTGIGFMHWVVADIPASVHELRGEALPEGALSTRSDLGRPGYVGLCPPAGSTHTYVLTLTALKTTKLPVDAKATPALVGFLAHGQTLGRARLTFRFWR
ncbi:MAG TPA: YbhB/YbcL family Raf kinase inhibitor-like protein [Asticcacaulis sp.]|nr:YbhB/YbcL family Raf kinase inhibitor-like protein [Asticcacaulis sp.]